MPDKNFYSYSGKNNKKDGRRENKKNTNKRSTKEVRNELPPVAKDLEPTKTLLNEVKEAKIAFEKESTSRAIKNKTAKATKSLSVFDSMAESAGKIIGSPRWFILSNVIVVLWLFSGFLIGFNSSWQSVIHTITSVITLIIMALLHYSQRKWEERMISIEKHQENILKLLENETLEIKKNIQRYDKLLKQNEIVHSGHFMPISADSSLSEVDVESINSLF